MFSWNNSGSLLSKYTSEHNHDKCWNNCILLVFGIYIELRVKMTQSLVREAR